LGKILCDRQVQVRLRKPVVPRANISSISPAVGGIHDDGAGEEIFGEIAAAFIWYLVGA
jgi:hypothetical protein